MIGIIKELDIEVAKPNVFQALVAKQYDMNTRFLKVTLKDSGTRIDVPNIATAKVIINAERKDGLSKGFEGVINSDGTVTVPIHSWMLELDGTVICDISVIDIVENYNKKLTTTSFTLIVEKAAFGGDDVSNDPQSDVLVELIEDCTDALQTLDETIEEKIDGKMDGAFEELSNLSYEIEDIKTTVALYNGNPDWSQYDFSGGLGFAYGPSTSPQKFQIEQGKRYRITFNFQEEISAVDSIGFYNEDYVYCYEVCDNARRVINENVVIYEGTAKVSGSFYVGLSCGIPDIKPINLSIGYYYPLGQLTSEVEDIKTNSGSAITDGSGKNAIQQKLDADKPTWSIGNEAVSVLVAEGIVAVNEKGEVIPGANGDFSSVLGGKGLALGKRSSARGTSSIALGAYSCAEGDQALAQGMGSNAIGCATSAIGPYSSSKGIKAKAIGEGSDAGGCETQAEGQFSFARGYKTIAKGLFASTFGAETEADESCQFVVGRHNLNKNDTLFEVGNGEAGSKSNAFEVCTDGSIRCGKQTTSSSGAYVLVTKGYLDMIVAQLQAQINSLK